MKATFQKALEIFLEKEGHRIWSKKTRFEHALEALQECGFFKHLSKVEIEKPLKEIENND